MTVIVSAALANAWAADVLAALDAGSGPALIKFYTATRPAGPDTAISTQTLLATLTCSDPSGSVSGRTLTWGSITADAAADADGTATWARILDSNLNAVVDASVGEAGSGADIIVNSAAFVTGSPVSITSLTLTF